MSHQQNDDVRFITSKHNYNFAIHHPKAKVCLLTSRSMYLLLKIFVVPVPIIIDIVVTFIELLLSLSFVRSLCSIKYLTLVVNLVY